MAIYYIAKDIVHFYDVEADSEAEAIEKVYNGDLYPVAEEVMHVSVYAPCTPSNEGAV